VASAAPARRLEFANGRRLAHRALAELGRDEGPVLRGPGREPLWPRGTVGSITHCEGYAAAVACSASDLASIGIDAERAGAVDSDVEELICAPEELRWCRRAQGPVDRRTLVFSAKESAYKALYPLVGRPIGFHEVVVRIDLSEREIALRFRGAGAEKRLNSRLTGKAGWRNGLVFTAVYIFNV
jgi:4'-phosphopantetheinyl transferase EntD